VRFRNAFFGKAVKKLAETLSEKKKSGYGILGQCRDQNMPKMGLRETKKSGS
jgi:hypothetical protein